MRAQGILHTLTLCVIGLTAAVLSFATGLALLGVLPWPRISASYGAIDLGAAGMWVQIGLTALMLALCSLLPTSLRVARLARGGRDDSIPTQVAPQLDTPRDGIALTSEFDAVRDRIRHLRAHPELVALEPEVLDVAAQMSRESAELARICSEARVGRARAVLERRQHEIEAMNERIDRARSTCDALKRWRADIATEERLAAARIAGLEADLREVLPMLGHVGTGGGDNVVQMSRPQK